MLHSENWNSSRLVWKGKKKTEPHAHPAHGRGNYRHRAAAAVEEEHSGSAGTHHAVVTVSSASSLAADGEVQINRDSSVVCVVWVAFGELKRSPWPDWRYGRNHPAPVFTWVCRPGCRDSCHVRTCRLCKQQQTTRLDRTRLLGVALQSS